MLERIRFRLIAWLLRHADFILVVDTPYNDGTHDGMVFETLSFHPEGKEAITGILVSCMENRPAVTESVLDAVIGHLQRYEVDCKNFVQKLYEKK